MQVMPRDTALDSSMALMREGYDFIGNRCKRLHTDIFATQLLMQDTICLRGEEEAKLFYDSELFTRQGAMPRAAQKTLTGQGAVMLTDGAQHRNRKAMFMSLMTPERIVALCDLFAEEWGRRLPSWQAKRRIRLFDEMQEILFCAVCKWTAVPLAEADAPWRTFEFGMLIDGAGGIGPRHWQARSARKSAERWLAGLVEQTRAQTLSPAPAEYTALHAVAFHREPDGALLDARLAAVELINVLRPTVAIARFITFAATALHQHPDCRERIAAEEEGYLDCFIHEVRRFYAFFPYTAARVAKDFDWHGYRFRQGTRVLLDVYGTNHDARIWNDPDTFNPDRFREWNGSPYNFIPQGAGDHYVTHRCAGEWVTIALMRVAILALATRLDYRVPEQDLRVDLRRMPMLPNSRFVMEDVRLTTQHA